MNIKTKWCVSDKGGPSDIIGIKANNCTGGRPLDLWIRRGSKMTKRSFQYLINAVNDLDDAKKIRKAATEHNARISIRYCDETGRELEVVTDNPLVLNTIYLAMGELIVRATKNVGEMAKKVSEECL